MRPVGVPITSPLHTLIININTFVRSVSDHAHHALVPQQPLLIAALDLLSSGMPCRSRETSSGTIKASITGLSVCICSHYRQQSSKPQLHSSSYNTLVQQVCCRVPLAASVIGSVHIATVEHFCCMPDADPAMNQLVTAQLPTQIASLVHIADIVWQQCACSCIMRIHNVV